MEKMHCVLAMMIQFFCMSIELSSMDLSNDNTIITLAFFAPNQVVLGSDKACHVIKNVTQKDHLQTKHLLHKEPTHNLIVDKKNQRIGLFSDNHFTVYDIKTNNKIWSHIINSQNCAAAFSHVDDRIFLCQNEHLTSNDGINITVPYFRDNIKIDIQCHPTKKELLYPYSNQGLAVYSFIDKQSTLYSPAIMPTDIIIRALYSPQGNHIVILTNNHNLFIYNPRNNSTISISESCCFASPTFILNSTILAFVSSVDRLKIQCWDFKKNQLLTTLHLYHDWITGLTNEFTNIFDFSDDGTEYVCTGSKITAQKAKTGHQITQHVQNYVHFFLRYCLLKKYSSCTPNNVLPREIIQLLIQQLRALYGW